MDEKSNLFQCILPDSSAKFFKTKFNMQKKPISVNISQSCHNFERGSLKMYIFQDNYFANDCRKEIYQQLN